MIAAIAAAIITSNRNTTNMQQRRGSKATTSMRISGIEQTIARGNPNVICEKHGLVYHSQCGCPLCGNN